MHVLVAEDDRRSAKLLVHLLERIGCTSAIAEDGRAVVDAVIEGRFDLVLMDVCMPRMSGVEATTHIRAHESDSGEHLPIIGVSADSLPGRAAQFIHAGMDGFVAKPIRAGELYETIARIAPRRR